MTQDRPDFCIRKLTCFGVKAIGIGLFGLVADEVNRDLRVLSIVKIQVESLPILLDFAIVRVWLSQDVKQNGLSLQNKRNLSKFITKAKKSRERLD